MSREFLNIGLAVVTVLSLAVGGPWAVDRLRHPPRPAWHPVVHSGQKLVTLEISGMYCATCASKVTDQLRATAGVVECGVDTRAQRATVVCDRALADTSLVAAVARAGAGYSATVVHR